MGNGRHRQIAAAGPGEGAALTRREHIVLEAVAGGDTDKEVASRLGISRRTVGKHLEHIFAKLDVHTRTAAAQRLLSGATSVQAHADAGDSNPGSRPSGRQS